MKKINLIILVFALFATTLFHANAQAPYKHSIGVTLGTTQAISYKTFPCNHFAIQLDLGTKYCYVYGTHLWSLELAPNFMYEGRLGGNLYGLVGLGGSIGYTWRSYLYIDSYGIYRYSHRNGKGGVNGIFGLEYKFPVPLVLQFDFRPGYRCVFTRYFGEHCFDWGVNFGVRYTF